MFGVVFFNVETFKTWDYKFTNNMFLSVLMRIVCIQVLLRVENRDYICDIASSMFENDKWNQIALTWNNKDGLKIYFNGNIYISLSLSLSLSISLCVCVCVCVCV